MNVVNRLAAFLDARAVMGIRLWQFSFNNLPRYFSWYFLVRVFMAFPLKALRGFLHYRNLVYRTQPNTLSGTLSQGEFLTRLSRESSTRLLITPGFCMKPYDDQKQMSLCPAGQFNHNCLLIQRINNLSADEWPSPCQQCGVAPLVQVAAKLGADVYIMTSALDIARDLFVPAMKASPTLGLFFLCPYSTEPFTFGLATAGIPGTLVTFCRGACNDHASWTRADKGVKNEQTFVHSPKFQQLWQDLEKIANRLRYKQETRYEQINNIYRALST